MKKFYSLLMILPFIGFGQNLLTNGDFETWDAEGLPEGWFIYNDQQSNVAQSTDANTGTYAVQFNGKVYPNQRVDVIAGKTYKLSVWYKVLSGDGSDARIWSKWRNADGWVNDPATQDVLQGPNGEYFTSSTDWAEYTTEVVAPEGATLLQFEVRSYNNAVTVWDNFSLECLDCENMGLNDNLDFGKKAVKVAVSNGNLLVQGVDAKSVEVYNVAGQKVANSTYVGNLAKGVYIAVVEDNNGNKTSVKFIK